MAPAPSSRRVMPLRTLNKSAMVSSAASPNRAPTKNNGPETATPCWTVRKVPPHTIVTATSANSGTVKRRRPAARSEGDMG